MCVFEGLVRILVSSFLLLSNPPAIEDPGSDPTTMTSYASKCMQNWFRHFVEHLVCVVETTKELE